MNRSSPDTWPEEFFEEMQSLIQGGFTLREAIDHVRPAPWAAGLLPHTSGVDSSRSSLRGILERRGIRCLPNPDARFWYLTDGGYQRESEQCILWTGGRSSSGYGMYKGTHAHRWIYQRIHGDLPAGVDVHHRCRTRLCVNPAHLEPLSRSMHGSVSNGFRAERSTCRRGHERSSFGSVHAGGKVWCRACARIRYLKRRISVLEQRIRDANAEIEILTGS